MPGVTSDSVPETPRLRSEAIFASMASPVRAERVIQTAVRVSSGERVAAATFDPSRGELFLAEKGAGAWLNGQRIHVSETASLDASLLIVVRHDQPHQLVVADVVAATDAQLATRPRDPELFAVTVVAALTDGRRI